ncbi:hypothetical protein C6569_10840 [Phreatobacter cathodiphilus]|uniref:WSC domain-containing protein n=1 Tax=Phreatobacter cathodiphilus TaxID=1868589 RepID=A0A2S0NBJ1_9HYPH|nr:hypothetical protein C6569_10840 [Phreatobacter cathodiphilus]
MIGPYVKATLLILARFDWRDDEVARRVEAMAVARLPGIVLPGGADAETEERLSGVLRAILTHVVAHAKAPDFDLQAFAERDFDPWWRRAFLPDEDPAVPAAPALAADPPRPSPETVAPAVRRPRPAAPPAATSLGWVIVLTLILGVSGAAFGLWAIFQPDDRPVVNVTTPFDGKVVQAGVPYVIDGWAFRGCFVDSPDRDLAFVSPPMTLTLQACSALCTARGARHMGLQNTNQCSCGNAEFGRHGRAQSCNKPCSGDGRAICGDVWSQAIFTRVGQ